MEKKENSSLLCSKCSKKEKLYFCEKNREKCPIACENCISPLKICLDCSKGVMKKMENESLEESKKRRFSLAELQDEKGGRFEKEEKEIFFPKLICVKIAILTKDAPSVIRLSLVNKRWMRMMEENCVNKILFFF